VEFYNGAIKVGEDNAAPFTFNWTGAAPGYHIVSARVLDSQGGSRQSHPVDLVCPRQAAARLPER
jgi:hypothetical protein